MALTPIQANRFSAELLVTLREMLGQRDTRTPETKIRDLLQSSVRGLGETSARKWAASILACETKEAAVLRALGLVDIARTATRDEVKKLSEAQMAQRRQAAAGPRIKAVTPDMVAQFKGSYLRAHGSSHGWAKACAKKFSISEDTAHRRFRAYGRAKGA
jgi:ribosomal protein L19E